MAEESGQSKSLDWVKQEIAHSRDRLARDLNGLRYELDFPGKIRRSFQRQTVVWIGAAAVLGMLLIVLPARKKKIYVDARGKNRPEKKILEAGLVLGVLKFAATLLKPVAVSFITRKLSGSGPSRRKW